jgi:hypothetical protein
MPVSRAAKVALLLLCSASTVNAKPSNAIFGAAVGIKCGAYAVIVKDQVVAEHCRYDPLHGWKAISARVILPIVVTTPLRWAVRCHPTLCNRCS